MIQTVRSLGDARLTTADALYARLRDDIEKMRLVPGTRLSEAEVAKRHSVSRQPVREAFIRLDHLQLLEIRPQKATIVRRMSRSTIERVRFVRESVEVEVARRACRHRNGAEGAVLGPVLQRQSACIESGDLSGFNELDHEFHAMLCRIARCEHAIPIIADCKAQVDRLCMLSLKDRKSMRKIHVDHRKIARRLASGQEARMVKATRRHLGRLDATVKAIQTDHPDYFEA